MIGAIHSAEPVWINGAATSPREIRAGDEAVVFTSGGVRRARVTKAMQGGGKGTIWLHTSSGAQIRCLMDERLAVYEAGRRRYRRAEAIQMGTCLCRMVGGRVTVDPVIAIRVLQESVPAIVLELPSVTLISEEGLLCRPS